MTLIKVVEGYTKRNNKCLGKQRRTYVITFVAVNTLYQCNFIRLNVEMSHLKN